MMFPRLLSLLILVGIGFTSPQDACSKSGATAA